MSTFLIASTIQGLVVLIDEFFFHHRRGLPRWERLGHPLDSSTVILCLTFLYFTQPSPTNVIIYYALAIASCLCVTKDEWVHWKYCGPEEMWLHAVLFILHPIVLYTAMSQWQEQSSEILLVGGFILTLFVYQVVYWNFLEGHIRKIRQKAHYRRLSQEDLYEYFGE